MTVAGILQSLDRGCLIGTNKINVLYAAPNDKHRRRLSPSNFTSGKGKVGLADPHDMSLKVFMHNIVPGMANQCKAF
ncbi:hypothetical protein KSP40_PGU018985 [Platanthera guangdongensis]|uniref:Uncharacterized protein n=1 Tax=Platanthera guangdongensis TaxID=2320717 RepID=A0ABR2MHD0_9ASPA